MWHIMNAVLVPYQYFTGVGVMHLSNHNRVKEGMNKQWSRCLAMLVAFTVTSFFVVMQASFLTLSPTSSTATKASKSLKRRRSLFRRYVQDECNGKEIILNILENNIDVKRCKVAVSREKKRNDGGLLQSRHVYGMTTCHLEDLCHELPQWKQIKNAYGPLPVIAGTDSCSPAQGDGQPSEVDIVGLFSNAGTVLLLTILKMNYPNLKVHNLNFTAAIKHQLWQEDTLRVVVVRDPFRWMADMVRGS
jgi:hypothetical protein